MPDQKAHKIHGKPAEYVILKRHFLECKFDVPDLLGTQVGQDALVAISSQ